MPEPIPIPKQARSRRTLEKLLDAAEGILSEKSFETATAAEIAARAGFTIGAFYARFPSKEALWDALSARIRAITVEGLDSLDRIDEKEVPLAEAIRLTVTTLTNLYRDNRKLAMAVRRPANGRTVLAEKVAVNNQRVLDRLAAHLLRWRREIGHRSPREAVDLGLLMMAETLRELFVLQEIGGRSRAMSPERIATELSAMLCSYLQVKSPRPRGSR